MNSGEFGHSLNVERGAFAVRQQRGVHFVAAAAVAWVVIAIVQGVVPAVGRRNLVTFMVAALMIPLAWLFSRQRGIPFQDESPLAGLGLLISIAQALYLPIAMWVYPTHPSRFVMVLAIITTAHLLPFSWLYDERAYVVAAVAGTVCVFFAGLTSPAVITAALTAAVFAGLTIILLGRSRRDAATNAEAYRG